MFQLVLQILQSYFRLSFRLHLPFPLLHQFLNFNGLFQLTGRRLFIDLVPIVRIRRRHYLSRSEDGYAQDILTVHHHLRKLRAVLDADLSAIVDPQLLLDLFLPILVLVVSLAVYEIKIQYLR